MPAKLKDTLVIGHIKDFDAIKRKYPFLTKEKTACEWKNFTEYLMNTVVQDRPGVDLPMYLGKMLVGAFPSKNNIFKDKRRKCEITRELDHFQIQERDGFEARILYTASKTKCVFRDSLFFGFRPSDTFKKKCTDAFKANWKRYVVIPNIRYMDMVMRKEVAKQRMSKEKLEKYNEFED